MALIDTAVEGNKLYCFKTEGDKSSIVQNAYDSTRTRDVKIHTW